MVTNLTEYVISKFKAANWEIIDEVDIYHRTHIIEYKRN